MPFSLKQIIEQAKHSAGIVTFGCVNPILIVTDSDGNEVDDYKKLKPVNLSEEELKFASSNWEKIIEQNPFYDGDVILVKDIVLEDDKIYVIMDKGKYSWICAMQDERYPKQDRCKEYLSFGLGLMSNFEVNPDNSFLMIKRSQNVFTEKGAISVPGGNVEYKKNEKEEVDDIKQGLNTAAFRELQEEVLSNVNQEDVKVIPISVSWSKKENGACGVDFYFEVSAKNLVNRLDVYNSYQSAQDKEESTGEFFFVSPDQFNEDINDAGKNLYISSGDMLKKKEILSSGRAAIATQVMKYILSAYCCRIFPGLPPSCDSIANIISDFTKSKFGIINYKDIEKSLLSIPGSIPGYTIVPKSNTKTTINSLGLTLELR